MTGQTKDTTVCGICGDFDKHSCKCVARSTGNPKAVRPAGRVEALLRIEAAVREIEMICDEFDMDPAQWLVGGSDE